MRKLHAFRHAGRSRSVENHRAAVRRGRHSLERTGIQQSLPSLALHRDTRQPLRHQLHSLDVGDHQLCRAILEDKIDGFGRELVVDRHRDHAGSHDGKIGDEIFGAIDSDQGNGVAGLQSTLDEPPRAGIGQRIHLPVGIMARILKIQTVDQSDRVRIFSRICQFAEVRPHSAPHCHPNRCGKGKFIPHHAFYID